ncbi:TPA: hypothetical protein DCW54_00970 [Candidatus Dependentiae bacterium]|nr:hypothetical protein [Candidatus Dependentiae bacterium]
MDSLALATIFSGYAFFASAISVNKLVLFSLPAFFFVGIRMLFSGITLLFFHVPNSKNIQKSNLRTDMANLLLIAALTTFIPSCLKAFGMQQLNSSHATLFGSLDPFVTAIYAYFLWGERINIRQFLGMCIAFLGIVFLITITNPTTPSFFTPRWLSIPEIATIVSMIISRYGWIRAQRILKNERYKPTELNGILMTISGIYALSFSLLTENWHRIIWPTNPAFYGVLAYAIFVGNIIGYSVYGALLKKYPITLLSLCGLSVPLFVHLFGPLIVGEPLSPYFLVALALVAAGTWIFITNKAKTPQAEINA